MPPRVVSGQDLQAARVIEALIFHTYSTCGDNCWAHAWSHAWAHAWARCSRLSVRLVLTTRQAQLGPSAPVSTTRIGFRLPPGNEEEGISVFMKLFQEAYERQNGFM